MQHGHLRVQVRSDWADKYLDYKKVRPMRTWWAVTPHIPLCFPLVVAALTIVSINAYDQIGRSICFWTRS